MASHLHCYEPGRQTIDPDHMPHRRYQQSTPGRLIRWVEKPGPATVAPIHILSNRPHPEQRFRSCLGIIRLGRQCMAHRIGVGSGR